MITPQQRALEHAKQSRMYLSRLLLQAGGERRARLNQIGRALDASIHMLEALIAEEMR